MPNARKPRTDSLPNLQRVFAAATTELAPPAHVPLTDADWPYWHSITDEFARADWTPHMLEIAALLARSMAQLEVEQRTLRAEGFLTPRKQGLGPNPRGRTVSTLTGQVLAYRRSLALTGRGKAGRSDDAAKQRIANRRIESPHRDTSPGDLLA